MENNRKVTKQLVVSNIADSIKILKKVISNNGYGSKLYITNDYAKIIYDMMYSLRDLRYSLQGYRIDVHRSKQDKVYSVSKIVAKLKSMLKCSCEEQLRKAMYSVIDLLKPICGYCEDNTTTNHRISVSQCALGGNLTEMQKSILFIDSRDLYKARIYLNNVISGNGKVYGTRLIEQYVDDCDASGDLLTILTLKNKVKSVIADIDNMIDLIDKAQKDIIRLNNSSNSEQADLSEDDELY